MKSILIRYTDSQYADSYRNGDLYMSSLSTFRDFKKGLIKYEDVISGKVTKEDIEKAKAFREMNQQDFQEGVSSQVPREYAMKFLPHDFADALKFDVRFRLEAYDFCNLLCFFRVDCMDTKEKVLLDEDNIANIINSRGHSVSAEQIRGMSPEEFYHLLDTFFPLNPQLASNQVHVIYLPDSRMDSFGDMAVLIRDEEEFISRVILAVRRQGGDVITGDIRYHQIQDRSNPEGLQMSPHVSLISSGDSGLFDMKELTKGCPDIIWYGCLDKYTIFENQKEWRVCWLPEEKNREAKILHVGRLDDIIELVPREKLRERLMEMNPGYFPGYVSQTRMNFKGTMSYGQFRRKIERIDGKCRMIMEIG